MIHASRGGGDPPPETASSFYKTRLRTLKRPPASRPWRGACRAQCQRLQMHAHAAMRSSQRHVSFSWCPVSAAAPVDEMRKMPSPALPRACVVAVFATTLTLVIADYSLEDDPLYQIENDPLWQPPVSPPLPPSPPRPSPPPEPSSPVLWWTKPCMPWCNRYTCNTCRSNAECCLGCGAEQGCHRPSASRLLRHRHPCHHHRRSRHRRPPPSPPPSPPHRPVRTHGIGLGLGLHLNTRRD